LDATGAGAEETGTGVEVTGAAVGCAAGNAVGGLGSGADVIGFEFVGDAADAFAISRTTRFGSFKLAVTTSFVVTPSRTTRTTDRSNWATRIF
jgi:hypothetical protein